MILYPTETIYALGVKALDDREVKSLFQLKGREEGKAVSWLVRDIADIQRYAQMDALALTLAERFLPGPLTLVLGARDEVPRSLISPDGTVGFRISSDPAAAQLIASFMDEYDMPLTCTSANVSGLPTLSTPKEILLQFGDRARMIDVVYDGGARSGVSSTVVRVLDGQVTVLREGAIPSAILLS
jgi:L-threonylcarbamoyladenylate synthase